MNYPSHTKADNIYGLIIPVFNSVQYLPQLLQEIAEVRKKNSAWQLEVLIVDDGSTPPVETSPMPSLKVSLLRHPENKGKGAALRSGFTRFLANPAIRGVITMDADMQHPPEYLPDFLAAFEMQQGDLIIGRRERNPRIMPLHRILSNYLTSRIISLLIRQSVPDSQCGYRLYSRNILENIRLTEQRFHLESEILIRAGWQNFKITSVPIPTIYNEAPSAIRHINDTLNFITMVLRLTKEKMFGNV